MDVCSETYAVNPFVDKLIQKPIPRQLDAVQHFAEATCLLQLISGDARKRILYATQRCYKGFGEACDSIPVMDVASFHTEIESASEDTSVERGELCASDGHSGGYLDGIQLHCTEQTSCFSLVITLATKRLEPKYFDQCPSYKLGFRVLGSLVAASSLEFIIPMYVFVWVCHMHPAAMLCPLGA